MRQVKSRPPRAVALRGLGSVSARGKQTPLTPSYRSHRYIGALAVIAPLHLSHPHFSAAVYCSLVQVSHLVGCFLGRFRHKENTLPCLICQALLAHLLLTFG
jgi:hypothetical protein